MGELLLLQLRNGGEITVQWICDKLNRDEHSVRSELHELQRLGLVESHPREDRFRLSDPGSILSQYLGEVGTVHAY